jgi:hypothetical protein
MEGARRFGNSINPENIDINKFKVIEKRVSAIFSERIAGSQEEKEMRPCPTRP